MTSFDLGLLSPLTVGHDRLVGDRAVLDALLAAERALVAAYADIGMLASDEHPIIDAVFDHMIDADALAADAVAGGNPVIPLVGQLRALVAADQRVWVHRGATSQDIIDTALMIAARAAVDRLRESLSRVTANLDDVVTRHGDTVVAARTLTQHAVPMTLGARIATWRRGIDRALVRLDALTLPAQLAGAAGTRASFLEITGSAVDARALVTAFAARVGLDDAPESWQVTRWPVTELGDALVQALDALGKIAGDVATLSRTEIGELREGTRGGSSAMPQKQNPVASTLIRSAALRAPQLGATLHLAAALAADERPAGSWHAEWPTLRELLRLALGASAHAVSLSENLRVDAGAAAHNLALTGGLLVSERLALVLVPLIGRDRFDALIREADAGADLGSLLRALPEAADLDIADLIDPAAYTGEHGDRS
ncbi:lyase family protein [Microbacterium sp. KSW4-16]|uniref:Adenylosuccinate lyase n=1 Tax=Microbacterium aurugineum TaxID=2851642 RepID=A0ABY4IY28_9MICO|nr:lyase family protein [Microbacterium aurugineum]MCK8468712.1 lyase family protein [Microbacterium aurugineum]UPL16701.1 adenylosuccinate lyase [Microbacterium aurugineum]